MGEHYYDASHERDHESKGEWKESFLLCCTLIQSLVAVTLGISPAYLI